MIKRKVLDLVITEVLERFHVLTAAAEDAKDAATNEESKAENKYDTRGLEASYLAGAQAKRAQELKESLYHLQKIQDSDLKIKSQAELLSFITLECEDGFIKKLFILPVQGGIKINLDGDFIQTITLTSPLGRALFKKTLGDEIELKQAGKMKVYELIEIL